MTFITRRPSQNLWEACILHLEEHLKVSLDNSYVFISILICFFAYIMTKFSFVIGIFQRD